MDLRTEEEIGETPKTENLDSKLKGMGSISEKDMLGNSKGSVSTKGMFFRADKIDLTSLDVQLEKHLSRVWSRNVEPDNRPKEVWEVDLAKLDIRYLVARGTYSTVYRGTYDGQDVAESNRLEEGTPPSLTIVPCDVSPILKSPIPSVRSSNWKSLKTFSVLTSSQNDLTNSNLGPEAVHISDAKPSKSITLMSARTSKSCFAPTDYLDSLRNDLEIIDSHCKSSALRRSSFRFSYKPVDIKPILVRKDVGVQTLLQDNELVEEESMVVFCNNCKCRTSRDVKDGNDSSKMKLVAVDELQSADKSKNLVPNRKGSGWSYKERWH